ncbi:FAD:protein FMN transferase [Salipiger pallidus]|nr:FAD:protein FMN transferase [Salipiger pallidus]
MGTSYNIVAVDKGSNVARADLQAAIDTALTEVNGQMSNWDSGSEISRFNAVQTGDAFEMSGPLGHVMQAAADVNLRSEGRFDTTMGPLIELWGFGAPGERSMPADVEIERALAASGHDNTLSVGETSLSKVRGDAQVYLAAIGKGYGADRVATALESLGISDYMVEIGGDLYASGRNPSGQPWQIGIEKPDSLTRGVLDVVGISGVGLASSGDYRNYFERDGKRFSHVIDPATGRPIEHHTAAATVIAENGMMADAWATAMLTLGRERGLEIAEAHDIAVVFIERDHAAGEGQFKTHASSRFGAMTA